MHAAYCCSVLFNKQNGVLRFLREVSSLDEVSACTTTAAINYKLVALPFNIYIRSP